MPAPSVIVIGAVNVDLVVAVTALPAPGQTVVGADLARHGGGKGANAAVAASRAGAAVTLVGAVGADDLGRAATAELQEEGVDVGALAVARERSTGVALVVVDRAGDNQIAVAAGANADVDPSAVGEVIGRRAGTPTVVVVSTEVPLAAVRAAVTAAAHAGLTCVLDPAPVVDGLGDVIGTEREARGRLVLTPNRGECADLAGWPDGDPDGAARALAERTWGPVVVTLGGDGALVARPGGEIGQRPARAALVADTTGAGDTFTGVLAAWLAAGADLDGAVDAAMVAAARSVAVPGARGGMPTRSVIEQDLQAEAGLDARTARSSSAEPGRARNQP